MSTIVIFLILIAVNAMAGCTAIRLIQRIKRPSRDRTGQSASILGLDRPPDPAGTAPASWRTSKGDRPTDPNFQWAVDQFIKELEENLRQKNADDQH
jgi:hypothetical protein